MVFASLSCNRSPRLHPVLEVLDGHWLSEVEPHARVARPVRRRLTIVGTLLLLCAGGSAVPGATPRTSAASEIHALIEQLPFVTDEVVRYSGAHPYSGNPFWPRDHTGKYAHLNEAKSTQSRVLRRIVEYGVEALPYLIAHLSDARKAKAGVPFAVLGDQYDARFRDPRKQPRGVNQGEADGVSDPSLPGYTLRVGDLCFAAVGQIVNRHLHPIDAQPGHLVNSPVERPALARAVKQDWGNLTRAAHRQSLIDDVLYDNRYVWASSPDALERLCFYYPGAAERITLKLLSYPVDDSVSRRADEFIQQELLTLEDPSVWRRRSTQFKVREGKAAGSMLLRLLAVRYAANTVGEVYGAPPEPQKAHALRILKHVAPRVDPYRPPFVNIRSSFDVLDTLSGSYFLQSTRVDEAVLRVFRSVVRGEGQYDPPRRRDDVALVCIRRLKDKAWNEELAAYCRRRIRELESGERGPVEEALLGWVKEALASLSTSRQAEELKRRT
jgi:hypothetical protein